MLPEPDLKYGHSKEQVLRICRERGIHYKKFWSAFGVNTCAIDEEGRTCFYTCDIERALYKLGCKDGVYHLWD